MEAAHTKYLSFVNSKRRTSKGKVKHHIHPKSLGGQDTPDNIVTLTPWEHAEAHRLIVYTLPLGSKERRNMIFAFKRCIQTVMKQMHRDDIY